MNVQATVPASQIAKIVWLLEDRGEVVESTAMIVKKALAIYEAQLGIAPDFTNAEAIEFLKRPRLKSLVSGSKLRPEDYRGIAREQHEQTTREVVNSNGPISASTVAEIDRMLKSLKTEGGNHGQET